MRTEKQIRESLANAEEAYKLINFDDEWKKDYTDGFLAALYFVLEDKEE